MKKIVITIPQKSYSFSAIEDTQFKFNCVLNFVSEIAYKNKCYSRIKLHHLCYLVAKKSYPEVGSQLICNAVSVVSNAYLGFKKNIQMPMRNDEKRPVIKRLYFPKNNPLMLDRHTLSMGNGCLSLFTTKGRLKISLLDLGQPKIFDFQQIKQAAIQKNNLTGDFILVITPYDLVPIRKAIVQSATSGDQNCIEACMSLQLKEAA